MPTATLETSRNHGFDERIGLRGGSRYAERVYRVDDEDPTVALATVLATVAPGTAWDGTLTTLKAADYMPVKQGGGFTWIRVGYLEEGWSSGGIDATAVSSTTFHEIIESAGQQEITADIDLEPIKPTSRFVPSRQLVVSGYRTGAQYLTAIAHWAGIQGKRNSNSVAIPGLLNVSGSNFTAVANELVALTMRATPVQQNLVRMDYTFSFGPAGSGTFGSPGTHQYIWQSEDEDGVPISTNLSEIYFATAYTPSSLWG